MKQMTDSEKLAKCLEFIKSLTKLTPVEQKGYETGNGVSFVVSKLAHDLLEELGEL